MTVDDLTIASSSGSESEVGPITDENLLALMQRTGYTITQENGQRKYGGPPPDWGNRPPPRGAEVFVGKIPRDVFEDELVPVFETAGRIYELRLMMDFDGKNRGYAFVMYHSKAEAKGAVKKLNNYEIRKGRLLGVCYSVDNCRLFVGGIPKSKKKDDIFTEMNKVTEGVVDVIVYPSASDKTKNRGFAFVEYTSHRAAAMARRKLIPGRIQLWGHPIAVDWAEPEQEVDEDIMDQVKVLYVRNLMLDTTEDTLLNIFSQYHPGCVERVKKIRDYAFIHFSSRETCMHAMKEVNGTEIDNAEVEVTLAKPVDKNDYNRMAKVGAKVLNQTNDSNPTLVQNSPAINQNGMYIYHPGIYGTELVYYPLAQTNMGSSPQAVRNGPMHNEKLRNGLAMRSSAVNNRSSYLGYSAGKATFGRYYAKNNLDRGSDVNGLACVEIPYDNPYNISDPTMHAALLPNGGSVPTLPATHALPVGQAVPQYLSPFAQTIPQMVSAPVPNKNADLILDELCQSSMWGAPSYQLFATLGHDGRRLFLYKVTIPAFANSFQPPKFSESVEESKLIAAEHVLACLGVQTDATPAVVPLATVVAPPTTSYQNVFPQAPQIQIGSATAAPPATPQGVAANAPTTTIPMSYVDSSTMVQPMAVMYQ